MNGWDATAVIRELEAQAQVPAAGPASAVRGRVPIVALTANATMHDRDRCMSVGMDSFLSKPVMIEKIQVSLWAEH
jgi:two-component system sensor histidine kinase/response regulator